ncbi:DUF6932 family protein [Nocardia amamiensis]|uniref:DUF6932 family protein n=1 Tax=Nocardia amamiensis TaxID=404578 RepID=UPI001E4AA3E7|nr:hypothetical protein [Nocardia amamiensis]
MIPSFDEATGFIPPGRYTCTLQEVQERLVEAKEFAASTTRATLFTGLLTYIAHWQDTSAKLQFSAPLLRAFWIAGSFASRKLDPVDIDITPVIDGLLADEAHGKPGSKMISKLTATASRRGTVWRCSPSAGIQSCSRIVQMRRWTATKRPISATGDGWTIGGSAVESTDLTYPR